MDSNSRRILVADDNAAMSKVICFTLERAGFNVVSAKNGQVAWQLVQQQPFDLVITDQQMPEMTGVELCQRIRELEAYRETPLVMLTAKSIELSAKQIPEELRLALILPKPFSPMDLAQEVGDCLSQTT